MNILNNPIRVYWICIPLIFIRTINLTYVHEKCDDCHGKGRVNSTLAAFAKVFTFKNYVFYFLIVLCGLTCFILLLMYIIRMCRPPMETDRPGEGATSFIRKFFTFD
ncbi:hypothetical protein SNEBB_000592 [Seison nebaliae]|nr:hypothetical protein SNEBB_000592 [Seison nebaliae]